MKSGKGVGLLVLGVIIVLLGFSVARSSPSSGYVPVMIIVGGIMALVGFGAGLEPVPSGTGEESVGFGDCTICGKTNLGVATKGDVSYCWTCHKTGAAQAYFSGMEKQNEDSASERYAEPRREPSAQVTRENLRNTARSLQLLGVEVRIKKYTALMEKYLDKITPQVSDTWRADELFLKVKGNMKYLYALMDDQTRFWIAQEVADTKFTADLRPLFKLGKSIADKQPKTLITDGAPNFHEAYTKEFWTRSNGTEHIREIRLAGKVHNNKMERFNGEIRDRERVMRTLEIPDTPILTGMRIYHNFVRPHMALDGKTPADKAGIEVKGKDKWLTLIQNASAKYKDPKQ